MKKEGKHSMTIRYTCSHLHDYNSVFGFIAVQNERDRISCRRQSTDDPDPGNGLAVQSLLKAEMESRQSKAGAVLENTAVGDDLANKQLASINDVCESMKQQLLILVEWAKHIPAFNDLQLDDQVCGSWIHSAFWIVNILFGFCVRLHYCARTPVNICCWGCRVDRCT